MFGFALAAAAVLLALPSQALAAQEFVRILGSSQMVSPLTPDPAPPARNVAADGSPKATLHAAKNEFESFQVYVKADANGIANLRVDPGKPLRPVNPTTGAPVPGGTPIPADNMTIYRENFITIGDDTGLDVPVGEREYRSDSEGALGKWPDALIPEKDYIYGHDRNAFPHRVVAGDKAVAWVDVLVPKDAATGVYEGSVLVKDDAGLSPVLPGELARGTTLKEIPVRVHVTGFEMPSTTTLKSGFMMGQQPAGDYTDDPCDGHPNFCATPENRWKLYAMYGRAGLENRVTQPNTFGVGDPGAAPKAEQDAQFVKYGLPLIQGLSSNPELAFGDPRRSRLGGARLTTVAATEWCAFQGNEPAQYQSWCLDRWELLANQYGFADRFFLYADDEMNTKEEWGEFKDRAAYAKSIWPQVQVLTTGTIKDGAVGTADEVVGAESQGATQNLDKIAVLANYMDNKRCEENGNTRNPHNLFVGDQRPTYDGFLNAPSPAPQPKNEVWLYTSNMSFADGTLESCLYESWPGYAIDQRDTQARAMGWMDYYYNVTGELYWKTTHNLDRAWTNQYEQGGNGDGNLFYPGTTAKIGGPAGSDIPVESIRLKKIRDARKDYEYMKEIEKRDAAAGATVPKKRVTDLIATVFGSRASAMHTTASVGQLEGARQALWDMLAASDPDDELEACDVNVRGTAGVAVEGTSGDNRLQGGVADENFCGGRGDDTILPAGGDDNVDGGDNTVKGDTISYAGAKAGVNINLTNEDAHDPLPQDADIGYDEYLLNMENVEGSEHGDIIYGNGGANSLAGGDGDADGADSFYAMGGDDLVSSRDGAADTVDCGAGHDRVLSDAVDAVSDTCEIDEKVGVVDDVAPTGTIIVKDGAEYANTLAVNLTLSATDNAGGTGVKEMRLKNGTDAWKAWEPYNATKAWTLKNVQGNQNVHVQFRDGNLNMSVADTDDITLDTVRPKVLASPSTLPSSTTRASIYTSAVAFFSAAEKIPVGNLAGNLNQSTFFLRIKGQTTKVEATYRYDETQAQDRAILTPTKPLLRDKIYQVVMTSGVKDAAGNALDQDPNTAGLQGKVWYFTTQR